MRESRTLRKFREGRCGRVTGLGPLHPVLCASCGARRLRSYLAGSGAPGNVGARGAEFVDVMPLQRH